ncbi:MAG: antitoxin VbhA family protein [Clostridia bacterium]|nr:antitoxin VbhA family protein [Clostridia bacterium]
MTQMGRSRRIAAVKTADAINAIEGVPVSDYARVLSYRWARGELTGEEMKAAIVASRRQHAEEGHRRG